MDKIILNILMGLLGIIDTYLKIILTSWPAAILLLGIFLLLRHRTSIDNLINHINKIGLSGIETNPDVDKQRKSSETYKTTDEIIKDINKNES